MAAREHDQDIVDGLCHWGVSRDAVRVVQGVIIVDLARGHYVECHVPSRSLVEFDRDGCVVEDYSARLPRPCLRGDILSSVIHLYQREE